MAGVKKMLKEMIVEKGKRYSMVLSPIGYFLCAVAAAAVSVGGVTAPLICAIAGAATHFNASAVSVGAIMVYFLSGEINDNGFIICALVLIVAGKWIMRDDNTPKTSAFISFISMAFSGVVFGLVVDGSMYSAAVNSLYAVAVSAAAYFVMQAIEALSMPSAITADRKTLISLSVLFVLVTALLSGLSVSVLNVGVIASCLIVLCACRFFGCTGGVICGVLTTAGIFLGDSELGIQTAFFGVAGLISGFFAKCSRITLASAFSGTILLGQLAIGMNDLSFFVQSDAIIGGILFMCIPERLVTMGGRICASTVKDTGEMLSKEIDFAAKALTDVRKNIIDVMSAFECKKKTETTAEKVTERICSKCRNRLDCWEKNFECTNAFFKKLEKGQSEIFPLGLECSNQKKILDEFEKCRREEAFSKMVSVRLNENRNFLFSQMEASEDIVSSLSERLSVSISKSLTATLCRTLEKNGIAFNSAIAYYSGNRLITEIYIPEKTEYNSEELCSLLCREMSVEFEISQPFTSDGETRLRFSQQTEYTVEIGKCCLSAKEGEKSGDTCGYFTDGLGFGYAYLSDGMGHGAAAAADSRLTAALFKRLIRLGMSCEGAVKMINSILLARNGEESFATLDIAKINLETGGVTLCKSGASPTLIKYGDSVMMFSFASNPVGIIHDISLSVKECEFSENNILVMTSDGVPENSYMYIKEQLSLETPTEILSDNICTYSRKITADCPKDDVTSMTVKLVKNDGKNLIDTHNCRI